MKHMFLRAVVVGIQGTPVDTFVLAKSRRADILCHHLITPRAESVRRNFTRSTKLA